MATESTDRLQELTIRNSQETAARILREFADKTTITIPDGADVSPDYRDGVHAGVEAVKNSLRELADNLTK